MSAQAAMHPVAPLASVTVLEIAGLGPTPFAAMLLADLGARVLRIERPDGREMGIGMTQSLSVMHRGREAIALDLKSAGGLAEFHRLLRSANVVIEGMRPGAAERLGIGPQDCLASNPGLVYGRLSGWGRDGAMAAAAGHDLNYAAVAGLASLVGTVGQPPVPPLTMGADFPAGFLLAFGLVSAVLHARTTGHGAVVDQSIVGASALYASIYRSLAAMGQWQAGRAANVLDGGAPYYRCYRTADGGYMAVAAIEERFYAVMMARLGLSQAPDRRDRANWPALADLLARTFGARPRAEWEALFDGTDACVTPVLDLDEAVLHAKRNGHTHLEFHNGVHQPSAQPAVLAPGGA